MKKLTKLNSKVIKVKINDAKTKLIELPKKVNKTEIMTKIKSKNDVRARKHAEYLATLPKSPIKRFFYRIHPKRLFYFVFSKRGATTILKFSGVGILIFSIFMGIIFAYYRKDLPKNITNLQSCSLGQTIKFYDRTNTVLLWSGAGDIDCRPVSINDMSPFLVDAVVASEDKKFYTHLGFDLVGTFRAAINNASGKSTQGGSTITQQYIKLTQLSSEQTIVRKIKELILSVELDASYNKRDILQAYLNEIGFAYQYNGAEAAARGLFDKSAKDLTLDEAAIMVGGIPSPDFYWVQNQDALKERKNYVLDQMVETKTISKEQAEEAKKVDTLAKLSKNKNQYKDIKAPHFVLEVFNQLKATYGKDVTKYGYTVTTTLDMEKQGFAEKAIADGMSKIDSTGFDNAALVSEEVSTGQVVAYVGSRDFNRPGYGQKNIAGTPRAPGSSVKPYDYATLMKSSQNWGPGSILYGWKTELPGWGKDPSKQLTDYGNSPGVGPASMRYALGNSKNIPAVKSIVISGDGDGIEGIRKMHRLMESLGVKSGFTNCGIGCDDVISTAIGDGGEIRLDEHVHGMSSLSRMGKVIPQVFVLKILDSKGKTILDNTKTPDPEQALDPQIAYLVNDMLADGDASYFRSKSRAARELNGFQDHVIPTAIKTGTTNNNENGWMMGYTPDYATGVWTGNHENKSTRFEGMHFLTGPIWGQYMRLVYEKKDKPAYWPRPEGIKTYTHDSQFFNLVKSACSGDRTCNYGATDIYPSWYTSKKQANTSEKVVIDTVSGKRATECTPTRARKEIVGGGLITPELEPNMPYYKEFLEPIRLRIGVGATEIIPDEGVVDDVHYCNDEKPTVSMNMPANCVGSCTITATVNEGTKKLKNLYFKKDGTILTGGSFDISAPGSYNYTYVVDSSGSTTFSAEVVDELLYDDTDTTTSNLTITPFVLDSALIVGANVKLTWDDITGPYTLQSNGNSSAITCTTSSSKCTATVPKATFGSSGTYTLSIKSTSSGRTTNTISLTF